MSSPSCHIIRSSSAIPTILSHCKVLCVPASPTPIPIPHHQVLTPIDILLLSCRVISFPISILSHQVYHLPRLYLATSYVSLNITVRHCTSTFTYCFSHVPNLSIHHLHLVIPNLIYPLVGLSSCFISIANFQPHSLPILSHR